MNPQHNPFGTPFGSKVNHQSHSHHQYLLHHQLHQQHQQQQKKAKLTTLIQPVPQEEDSSYKENSFPSAPLPPLSAHPHPLPKYESYEAFGELSPQEPESSDRDNPRTQTLTLECPVCGDHFAIKSLLHGHLKDQHQLSPFPCRIKDCGQRFDYSTHLTEHFRNLHGFHNQKYADGFVWHCDECGQDFAKAARLTTHTWNYHERGTFRCSVHHEFRRSIRYEVQKHTMTCCPKSKNVRDANDDDGEEDADLEYPQQNIPEPILNPPPRSSMNSSRASQSVNPVNLVDPHQLNSQAHIPPPQSAHSQHQQNIPRESIVNPPPRSSMNPSRAPQSVNPVSLVDPHQLNSQAHIPPPQSAHSQHHQQNIPHFSFNSCSSVNPQVSREQVNPRSSLAKESQSFFISSQHFASSSSTSRVDPRFIPLHSVNPQLAAPYSVTPHSVTPQNVNSQPVNPPPKRVTLQLRDPHLLNLDEERMRQSLNPRHSQRSESQVVTPQSAYHQWLNAHSVNPQSMNSQFVNPYSVNSHSVNPHSVIPQKATPKPISPQLVNPQQQNLQQLKRQLANPYSANQSQRSKSKAVNPQFVNSQSMNSQSVNPQVVNPPQSRDPQPQNLQLLKRLLVNPQDSAASKRYKSQSMNPQSMNPQSMKPESITPKSSPSKLIPPTSTTQTKPNPTHAQQHPHHLDLSVSAFLELHFKMDPYPSTQVKEFIAAGLQIELKRVHNWFNSRRAKEKKLSAQSQLTSTPTTPTSTDKNPLRNILSTPNLINGSQPVLFKHPNQQQNFLSPIQLMTVQDCPLDFSAKRPKLLLANASTQTEDVTTDKLLDDDGLINESDEQNVDHGDAKIVEDLIKSSDLIRSLDDDGYFDDGESLSNQEIKQEQEDLTVQDLIDQVVDKKIDDDDQEEELEEEEQEDLMRFLSDSVHEASDVPLEEEELVGEEEELDKEEEELDEEEEELELEVKEQILSDQDDESYPFDYDLFSSMEDLISGSFDMAIQQDDPEDEDDQGQESQEEGQASQEKAQGSQESQFQSQSTAKTDDSLQIEATQADLVRIISDSSSTKLPLPPPTSAAYLANLYRQIDEMKKQTITDFDIEDFRD